jgi:protein-L-isoaspartate O-methyltransferase
LANGAARRTLEAHLNPLEACEANTPYPLGHTAHELARLARQARLIDPITRRFLAAAGVGQGMRVLDLGSGVGDTAFLLAECVAILCHGVASAEEVGIANLCERMLHEAQVRDALIVGRSEIGAWVRKPH